MSSFENGHREPSPETMERISIALQFPMKFFYQHAPSEVPEGSVSFRARTKVAAYKKSAALAGSELGVEISDWIDSRFNTPRPDLPSLTKFSRLYSTGTDSDPEAAADIIRASWGLGIHPIRNMVHLLEAHGVRVFSLTGDAAEVDAFSFWSNGRPFVFLNTLKSGERGRFDAAHELGHLILHAERDSCSSRDIEREADRFASALLMPEEDVRAHAAPYASVEYILKAKARWRVSAMALTYRLRELELLSDWVYRETCINLARLGYKSSEPGGIPRESSQLLAKVLHGATTSGALSLADDLNLRPADIRDLVFGLTVTSLDGGGQSTTARSTALKLVHSNPPTRTS